MNVWSGARGGGARGRIWVSSVSLALIAGSELRQERVEVFVQRGISIEGKTGPPKPNEESLSGRRESAGRSEAFRSGAL